VRVTGQHCGDEYAEGVSAIRFRGALEDFVVRRNAEITPDEIAALAPERIDVLEVLGVTSTRTRNLARDRRARRGEPGPGFALVSDLGWRVTRREVHEYTIELHDFRFQLRNTDAIRVDSDGRKASRLKSPNCQVPRLPKHQKENKPK